MVSATLVMPNGGGPPPDSAQASKNREPDKQARKRTVFIVDDERLVADTLAEILNDSGFEAIPVYSGQAALELLDKGAPDILITDVVMPGVNGIDVAKTFMTLSPKTRVVLLSGQAETRDLLRQAEREGASFELWAKPVPPDVVIKRLNQQPN